MARYALILIKWVQSAGDLGIARMNQTTSAWQRFLTTISAMTAALVVVALLPLGGRCLIHIKSDGSSFCK
jgi:hypothetical protein